MAVQVMALDALVDLVNGWGSQPRAAAGEEQDAHPPLADLLARAGAPDQIAAAVTDPTLQRVADLLYPVFAATLVDERAELVTNLLATCGVRPALHTVDGAIRATWLIPDSRDAILAAAATALHGQLVGHGPDRLGICAGQRCADAYIDASPAGDRRFCSITCQTRTRVATFRRRKNATA
jgi:predicted RNA-binding Zn ribbon-like protein